ncbi:zinc finger, CCHC-type containing protein [Tanacetum coccineum]
MGAHLIGRIAIHFGLMSTTALRLVTRGQETTLIDVVKLGKLGIVRFNSFRHVEIVNEMLDNSDEEADAAEARRAQKENKGSPRRRPNMGFTNRLRVMDDRLGEIDQHIYRIGGEAKELTKVVLVMSKPYDQFYGEFRGMRLEQERSEDPIQHLKDFLRIVDSIDLNGAARNIAHLRLFYFSLHDQAINWLDCLPAGSNSTWDDLTTRFLTQFFPPGRTAKLRKDILMFQQRQDESLYDA